LSFADHALVKRAIEGSGVPIVRVVDAEARLRASVERTNAALAKRVEHERRVAGFKAGLFPRRRSTLIDEAQLRSAMDLTDCVLSGDF
jgi:hypothetical protein